TLSFTSLFVLRRREPDSPRPYRAIGHPFTTALALIASVAFLIGAVASDTRNSVYALVLLAVSFPVYLLFQPRRHDLPIGSPAFPRVPDPVELLQRARSARRRESIDFRPYLAAPRSRGSGARARSVLHGDRGR